MITRQRGELVCECDEGCGTEFPGGVQEDFRAFVAELKAAGWKVEMVRGEWTHTCPDCREDD